MRNTCVALLKSLTRTQRCYAQSNVSRNITTASLAVRPRSLLLMARENNLSQNIPLSSSSPPRFYHASSIIEFPVRRRRRTKPKETSTTEESDEPIQSPLKHIAVDDDVEFVQAASALFEKLEKGLAPMKAQNEFFEVERFFGDMGEVLTLDLGPKEGKYRIEMSLDDHIFEYSSPISGKILYILSAETREWVGIEDGHAFEGLLVRDLIRQCQGLPRL